MQTRSLSFRKFKQLIKNKNNLYFLLNIFLQYKVIFPLKIIFLFIFLIRLIIDFQYKKKEYLFITLSLFLLIYKSYYSEIRYISLKYSYIYRNEIFKGFVIYKRNFFKLEISYSLIRFFYKFYPSFFTLKHAKFSNKYLILNTVIIRERLLDDRNFFKKFQLYQNYLDLPLISIENILPKIYIYFRKKVISFINKLYNLLIKLITFFLPFIGSLTFNQLRISVIALVINPIFNIEIVNLRIKRNRNLIPLELEIRKFLLNKINTSKIKILISNFKKSNNLEYRRYKQLRNRLFIFKFIIFIKDIVVINFIFLHYPFIFFFILFWILFFLNLISILIRIFIFYISVKEEFITNKSSFFELESFLKYFELSL